MRASYLLQPAWVRSFVTQMDIKFNLRRCQDNILSIRRLCPCHNSKLMLWVLWTATICCHSASARSIVRLPISIWWQLVMGTSLKEKVVSITGPIIWLTLLRKTILVATKVLVTKPMAKARLLKLQSRSKSLQTHQKTRKRLHGKGKCRPQSASQSLLLNRILPLRWLRFRIKWDQNKTFNQDKWLRCQESRIKSHCAIWAGPTRQTTFNLTQEWLLCPTIVSL